MTNENNEELPKPVLIEDLGRMFHTESSKYKVRYGIYKCGFCGNEFKANTNNVVQGKTRSCGCLKEKISKEGTNRKHNLTNTRLYNIWKAIKNRVLNPKNKNYNDYGGRGITICEEWLDVQNFYNWAISNGYEENKGLSIDRIDNDGNYCPENCRWSTKSIQARNTRIPKNNTSGYKGVSYIKRRGDYRVQIMVNLKSIHLGYFKTAVEGAIAYNNYIIENNLEGFILNEIPTECLQVKVFRWNLNKTIITKESIMYDIKNKEYYEPNKQKIYS